jgi:hypothetical protein
MDSLSAAAAAAAHSVLFSWFVTQSVLDLVCLGIGMMLGKFLYACCHSFPQQIGHAVRSSWSVGHM